MAKIRKILSENESEAQKERIYEMRFIDLWSIGLFTISEQFCSEFQSDLRKANCGCKWKHMTNAFENGLSCLNFVQKMGVYDST